MEMVKNTKFYWTFTFLLLVISTCSCMAFDAATVDGRILLILHPDMVDFDYSCGRFFRSSSLAKDADKLYKLLNEARKKADGANAKVDEEIKALNQKKFELQSSLCKEQQVFSPGDLQKLKKEKENYVAALGQLEKKHASSTDEATVIDARKEDIKKSIQNLTNALEFKDFKPRENEIKKLNEQIAAIDKKIALCSDKKHKNEEEALKVVYLTTEETESRIDKVKKEIKQIIIDTAKQNKVSLVVDNSFAVQSLKSVQRNTNIPISEGAPDIMSASLFHSFSNYETDKFLEEHLPMPKGVSAAEHLLEGRAGGLVNNLRLYLEFRNYLPQKVANLSCSSIFLSGAEDLTIPCAKKIFAKYNVPETLRQYYLNLLKDFLKLTE